MLSHLAGPFALLEIWLDESARRLRPPVRSLDSYPGFPVFGYSSTPNGVPLDPYGRNIYLDTYDSAYGPGWGAREHLPDAQSDGHFCYGFSSASRTTATRQGRS